MASFGELPFCASVASASGDFLEKVVTLGSRAEGELTWLSDGGQQG